MAILGFFLKLERMIKVVLGFEYEHAHVRWDTLIPSLPAQFLPEQWEGLINCSLESSLTLSVLVGDLGVFGQLFASHEPPFSWSYFFYIALSRVRDC